MGAGGEKHPAVRSQQQVCAHGPPGHGEASPTHGGHTITRTAKSCTEWCQRRDETRAGNTVAPARPTSGTATREGRGSTRASSGHPGRHRPSPAPSPGAPARPRPPLHTPTHRFPPKHTQTPPWPHSRGVARDGKQLRAAAAGGLAPGGRWAAVVSPDGVAAGQQEGVQGGQAGVRRAVKRQGEAHG